MPRYDLVIFDCDSTLTSLEGVDELARRAGVVTEVAALTQRAMDGGLPLEDVYAQRLALIRPDRAALTWLGERYTETLVLGACETVAALRADNREVHMVSGGLLPAVAALGAHLDLPRGNVHAVGVRHTPAGTYAGFDEASPLARGGGKALVVREIVGGGRRAVMVGDGATDLEARDAGALVVGFGGVVVRAVVQEQADRYLPGPSLQQLLPLLTALEAAR